jgi:farnesyl diphosphate synthase
MAFRQRLEQAATAVEARLGATLDQVAAQGAPPRLIAAMRLGALGGGKRLRPFLVIECAGLFGVASPQVLQAAAAVECVHCYSLVHDDLPDMDDDDMRRGQPTVHRAFDAWTAILAGDALLTAAFGLLASSEAHPEASVRAELAAVLARAAGASGMAGGQCLDMEADKLDTPRVPDAAHVDRLQAMKTGALIRAACEMGAVHGKAQPAQRRALVVYGERLGRAFQIADDLLDVEGAAATVGKSTGKDAGKATLIAALGVPGARARLATAEAEALAALSPFGAEADVLRDTVRFVVRRQH